jgi:hypothetical protein
MSGYRRAWRKADGSIFLATACASALVSTSLKPPSICLKTGTDVVCIVGFMRVFLERVSRPSCLVGEQRVRDQHGVVKGAHGGIGVFRLRIAAAQKIQPLF